MKKTTSGFTIVELLIVIVVIAVLAAITVVAFNGIQTRSMNVSRVSAAGQTYKLLLSYIATYGTLPAAAGAYCLTSDNICSNFAGTTIVSSNSSLMTELRKIGNPPASFNRGSATRYGLSIDNYAPRLYGGSSATALMMYWLEGQNADCGLPTVMFSSGENYVASSTKWTSTSPTITSCWVTLPNS